MSIVRGALYYSGPVSWKVLLNSNLPAAPNTASKRGLHHRPKFHDKFTFHRLGDGVSLEGVPLFCKSSIKRTPSRISVSFNPIGVLKYYYSEMRRELRSC